MLTFALLGVGLYTVLSGYVGFSQLSDVFDEMFTQLGIGEFTDVDAANTAGMIASIAQTVIWIIAAVGAGICAAAWSARVLVAPCWGRARAT